MPHLDTQDSQTTIVLKAAGFAPGQPTVPPVLLDPAAPAVQSVAAVLRRWMDVIDSTREGVDGDVDSEYLHELRTAVRATRSILGLADDLLPASRIERFADDFAWLGGLTTPLRDIDVYLSELAGRGAIDVTGLDELDPLRRHLVRQRGPALRALRTGLRSPRGARLSADWRHTLDALGGVPASAPSGAVAGAHALKAYRRIVKASANVVAATPAEDLHRLRRRCKRMRYLLDSYESLYDPTEYRAVVAALKKLQDCLGDIQDSAGQRAQLAEIAQVLVARGTPVPTVLAMGALRERNSARDLAARHDLSRRLARFAAPAMRAHVRALAVGR
jgi:CHAD domain-containing protein